MSDAKVKFHISPDAREDDVPARGSEQSFSFKCPKANRRCGRLLIAGRTGIKHDPQGQNGGRPHWQWDGNHEAPTFTPSVDCGGCWHGYIEKGRCVSVAKVDEPGFNIETQD